MKKVLVVLVLVFLVVISLSSEFKGFHTDKENQCYFKFSLSTMTDKAEKLKPQDKTSKEKQGQCQKNWCKSRQQQCFEPKKKDPEEIPVLK